MSITVKFNPAVNSLQAQILPNASESNDGVMTKEQVQQLNSGASGMAIGGLITNSPLDGSVLFVGAGGLLAQDNANFFWNETTNRLGIGTTDPAYPLDVVATGAGLPAAHLQGNLLFSADADRGISISQISTADASGRGLNVRAGQGNGLGSGGNTIVQGANGGANGAGGLAQLLGGSAGGGNNNGGTVTVRGGAKTGSGLDGSVVIGDDVTRFTQIGAAGMRVQNPTLFTSEVGFYGQTPTVQPSSTGSTAGFTGGAGTTVDSQATFTGSMGTKAYTIDDLVLHLKTLGLLAAS